MREILSLLAERESSEFVDCSSPKRATAMVRQILLHAKNKIYIFTDHLNTDIYGDRDVIEAAHEFLRKENSELVIIMQFNHKNKDILLSNTFLKNLGEFNDKMLIYEAKGILKSFDYHFILANTQNKNYSLMYEYDIVNHLSTGTFNGEFIQEKIIEFLDKVLQSMSVEKIDNAFWLKKINEV